jgi:hypothetical protein
LSKSRKTKKLSKQIPNHFLSAVTDFQPSKMQNKIAGNGKEK